MRITGVGGSSCTGLAAGRFDVIAGFPPFAGARFYLLCQRSILVYWAIIPSSVLNVALEI